MSGLTVEQEFKLKAIDTTLGSHTREQLEGYFVEVWRQLFVALNALEAMQAERDALYQKACEPSTALEHLNNQSQNGAAKGCPTKSE